MNELQPDNFSGLEKDTAFKEAFSKLYLENQRLIYSYIFSTVANKAVADDIFQETGVTLWKKFATFQEGTSFLHWAKAIAKFKLKEYWRKIGRDKLVLCEDLSNEIHEQQSQMHDGLNKRQRQLQYCIESLPSNNREIVQKFYQEKKTADELSTLTGRSIFAIRKSIHKIRKKLFDCIDQNLEGLYE
ncbi:MAG: sigma-70 family RNA polymerase sigma factor [Lentisphaeraceae bacterium]|nr:sigma-70 family RNA polymerase sigma factor [Lentisphaeraceae bacterium]